MPIRSLVALFIVLLVPVPPATAQEVRAEDIEATRSEMLKRWGVDGLGKPSDVEARAKAILEKPLTEQTDAELRELAAQANAAANFVGFILEEYEEYYRENYRFDFVQEKIAPYHDAYVNLSNRLKGYRNQAYYNMGKKALERGDEIAAFFLFRDAYRLSSFTEERGDHKGMRYLAEIEMKTILGIEPMGTFIYWK